MSDEILHQRIAEAVLGPPDPERDRALEAELSDRPELLEVYRRLREAWEDLVDLPPREPPEGARDEARRAVLDALAPGASGAGPARRERAARESGVAPDPRGERLRPRARSGTPALRAAAAAGLFLAGAAAGAWARPHLEPVHEPGPGATAGAETDTAPGPVPEGTPRFALLIRGGDRPGQEARAFREMQEWVESIWSEDRLLWADRFEPERAVWVGGPRPEPGEAPPLGGMVVIRAPDREEAAGIARRSPHLDWGGMVEIVPVAPVP